MMKESSRSLLALPAAPMAKWNSRPRRHAPLSIFRVRSDLGPLDFDSETASIVERPSYFLIFNTASAYYIDRQRTSLVYIGHQMPY